MMFELCVLLCSDFLLLYACVCACCVVSLLFPFFVFVLRVVFSVFFPCFVCLSVLFLCCACFCVCLLFLLLCIIMFWFDVCLLVWCCCVRVCCFVLFRFAVRVRALCCCMMCSLLYFLYCVCVCRGASCLLPF